LHWCCSIQYCTLRVYGYSVNNDLQVHNIYKIHRSNFKRNFRFSLAPTRPVSAPSGGDGVLLSVPDDGDGTPPSAPSGGGVPPSDPDDGDGTPPSAPSGGGVPLSDPDGGDGIPPSSLDGGTGNPEYGLLKKKGKIKSTITLIANMILHISLQDILNNFSVLNIKYH
jgi:hypothetical protein